MTIVFRVAIQRLKGCALHAGVGIDSHQDHGVDPQLLKGQVEVGAAEDAEPALGSEYEVGWVGPQLGHELGLRRPHQVVSADGAGQRGRQPLVDRLHGLPEPVVPELDHPVREHAVVEDHVDDPNGVPARELHQGSDAVGDRGCGPRPPTWWPRWGRGGRDGSRW